MKNPKKKPNGIYVLDVKVPCEETGELKRQRVSCETRDFEEAKEQWNQWLLGKHPKHPNMGGVVAAKGRGPDTHREVTVNPNGMTLKLWLTRCLDTIWKQPEGPGQPGCKSWKSAWSNVKKLFEFIDPDPLLTDIDTQYLKELRDRLKKEGGYAPATVRRKMMAVSAALTEALKMDHSEGEPLISSKPVMPTLEEANNTQDRTLSRIEEEAVLRAIDRRIETEPSRPWWQFKAYFIIGIDLGFRSGETLSMGPQNISEKRWLDPVSGEMESGYFLAIPRYVAKNDKPRDVPCTDRVVALFETLNTITAGGKWFPWKKGGSGVWYLWDNIRRDVAEEGFDLSDVKLHTFRHTCATRLAEGGLDLVSLRDWLGHSDIKITAERYVHLMATHLHRGAIILNGGRMSHKVPSDSPNNTQGESYDSNVSMTNRDRGDTPLPH